MKAGLAGFGGFFFFWIWSLKMPMVWSQQFVIMVTKCTDGQTLIPHFGICFSERIFCDYHSFICIFRIIIKTSDWNVACQLGISEQVVISHSRGSSQPRDWTRISLSPALAGGFSTLISTYSSINIDTTL